MHYKNRPNWMLKKTNAGYSHAVFKCERFRLHHDPRWRACIAIAKCTGQRCRLHALPGADHCHKHGGYRAAYLAAGVDWSKATMRSVPRKELATIGSGEAPRDMVVTRLPKSPIDRGRLYEAWRNRHLAPQIWLLEQTKAILEADRDAARGLR